MFENMLKTVFFDLGNVLIFFSNAKMFSQIADLAELKVSDVQQLLFETNLGEIYETGKIDTAELYRIFQKHSKHPFSLWEFMEAMSDIFTPNQEIVPLVEKLKERGIRLVLLSNTCECHYNRIYSHYPVVRLFDHKILSFQAGVRKPSPLIFQKALAVANCDPKECFYIDDIPEYISSARKAGLNGSVYTGISNLRRDFANFSIKI